MPIDFNTLRAAKTEHDEKQRRERAVYELEQAEIGAHAINNFIDWLKPLGIRPESTDYGSHTQKAYVYTNGLTFTKDTELFGPDRLMIVSQKTGKTEYIPCSDTHTSTWEPDYLQKIRAWVVESLNTLLTPVEPDPADEPVPFYPCFYGTLSEIEWDPYLNDDWTLDDRGYDDYTDFSEYRVNHGYDDEPGYPDNEHDYPDDDDDHWDDDGYDQFDGYFNHGEDDGEIGESEESSPALADNDFDEDEYLDDIEAREPQRYLGMDDEEYEAALKNEPPAELHPPTESFLPADGNGIFPPVIKDDFKPWTRLDDGETED